MDLEFTETQTMLRDTLARFLADTYGFEQRKKMLASDGGRDPGIWRALATELGLLSAPFAEECQSASNRDPRSAPNRDPLGGSGIR